MNYNSRWMLTPGPSRKRKDREAFYSCKPSSTHSASAQAQAQAQAQAAGKRQQPVSKPEEPASSNGLLAGYMAYEFLSKGTLFGQKFDPGRAQAVAVGGGGGEWKSEKEHESYGEVASILKSDGAHIPDVVNPTQLARWIQM